MFTVSSSSPVLFGAHSPQVGGQVLSPACSAQEVVWASWSTFASEPAIHVGPIAAVTTATGALTAARMVALHMVVELQGESVTQLTLHHLMRLWVLFSALRPKERFSFINENNIKRKTARMMKQTTSKVMYVTLVPWVGNFELRPLGVTMVFPIATPKGHSSKFPRKGTSKVMYVTLVPWVGNFEMHPLGVTMAFPIATPRGRSSKFPWKGTAFTQNNTINDK